MATREKTLLEFSASRLGRLYSMMIPTLVLVAATNYLEALRYPHAFDAYANIPSAIRYVSSGFFISGYWLWPDLAPPNMPLWRLSYEVVFYVGIALFVFAKGRTRILSLIALMLVTGPTVLLLAPTWAVGYWAYHHAKKQILHPGTGFVLWLGSIVLLLLCPFVEIHFRQHLPFLRMPDASVGGLLAAYANAFSFALNLFAFNAFADKAEILLRPFTAVIRWLGSLTFAMYMLHQPILSLFTVYGLSDPTSLAQAALMIGSVLLVVCTIGRYFENSKGSYKRMFLAMWNRTASLRVRYAAPPAE
jgi:peptidoglycan/LPS O-acetylase OafA/YrhL